MARNRHWDEDCLKILRQVELDLAVRAPPVDGLAAKAAGIPFLAVCTGKYDPSAFTDSDAVAVIDTLADSCEAILGALQGQLAS